MSGCQDSGPGKKGIAGFGCLEDGEFHPTQVVVGYQATGDVVPGVVTGYQGTGHITLNKYLFSDEIQRLYKFPTIGILL